MKCHGTCLKVALKKCSGRCLEMTTFLFKSAMEQFFLLKLIFMLITKVLTEVHVWINMSKQVGAYQLLENLILSFKVAKEKFLKIQSVGWFWDFTYFGIFNTSSPSCLKDLKTVFSCKKWTLTLLVRQCFTQIAKLFNWAFFSQSTFSLISSEGINEISWEPNVLFQKFLHKNWAERTAI